MQSMGNGRSFTLAVMFAVALLVSSSAHAAVIYVDPSSPTNGLGTTWPNAYHSLTDALNAASSGDEVHVAGNETYKPTSYSASFTMKAGVLILGGYAGFSATTPDLRDDNPLTNGCILSGDVDNDGILNGDTGSPVTHHNCYHVVVAPSAGGTMGESDTRLDGFKITMGYADNTSGAGAIDAGGGILIDNGPLIRNCWIVGNFATAFGGGGVCVRANRSPVFRNCIIDDNSTDSVFGGGGMMLYDGSSVKVLNCTIKNNTAPYAGGLMSSNATDLKVICCTIDGNTSTSGEGGGMKIYKASTNTTVDILNCLITNNVAEGTGSNGGGINFSKAVGGIGIANCTFDGNAATEGGAYYQINTYSQNDEVTIKNSIFWDNGSNEIHVEYGDLTLEYCDIDGGFAGVTTGSSGFKHDGGNNINENPQYLNPGAGDYRLYAGSPCRHTGDDTNFPADVNDVDENPANDGGPTPDRNLDTRIVCHVDRGAFEWQHGCLLGDVNNDGFINTDDLIIIITTWEHAPRRRRSSAVTATSTRPAATALLTPMTSSRSSAAGANARAAKT